MTVRELSQLYYLKSFIERSERQLEDMEERCLLKSPALSGMPRKPGVSDIIGEATAACTDLESRIIQERAAYEAEKARLESYLYGIEDAHTRLIFTLRFVDLKNWIEVADEIGGNNTAASVKQACYRYLKSSNFVPHVTNECDKLSV